MIQPHFQGFKDLILTELQQATQSIKIAVAWFTDKDVFNLLVKKRQEGISVVLVLSNDDTNFKRDYSLDFNRFKSMGCVLVVVQSSFMHHKFCIIDEAVLLMGSVNYTKNGFFKNKESFFKITEEPDTIESFLAEFELLLEGFVGASGIVISPEKQRLVNEVTLLNKQVAWLEIAISEAEKQLLTYEVRYRHRFQDMLERILYLQKTLAARQAQLTQKVEEKEAAASAEQRYQEFQESVTENVEQVTKLTDVDLQKELKQLYREGVKLCHPDNATIQDKTKANAIFDALKKAYENNDIAKVKELVSDLKSGIAFTEDFTEIAIDSLVQLFDRLKRKFESLTAEWEALTKDKRYAIMQADEAYIEDHFRQEEEVLKTVFEQLSSQLAKTTIL